MPASQSLRQALDAILGERVGRDKGACLRKRLEVGVGGAALEVGQAMACVSNACAQLAVLVQRKVAA